MIPHALTLHSAEKKQPTNIIELVVTCLTRRHVHWWISIAKLCTYTLTDINCNIMYCKHIWPFCHHTCHCVCGLVQLFLFVLNLSSVKYLLAKVRRDLILIEHNYDQSTDVIYQFQFSLFCCPEPPKALISVYNPIFRLKSHNTHIIRAPMKEMVRGPRRSKTILRNIYVFVSVCS